MWWKHKPKTEHNEHNSACFSPLAFVVILIKSFQDESNCIFLLFFYFVFQIKCGNDWHQGQGGNATRGWTRYLKRPNWPKSIPAQWITLFLLFKRFYTFSRPNTQFMVPRTFAELRFWLPERCFLRLVFG